MRNLTIVLAFLLAALDAAVLAQNPKYPPISEYMMTPEAEIGLARSAAPESVSAHATVKILTNSGYKVAAQGDNGFTCLVMRGWSHFGASQSLVACAPHSWRTEEARNRGLRTDGVAHPADRQAATLADLENLPTESCRRDRRDRFLHGGRRSACGYCSCSW